MAFKWIINHWTRIRIDILLFVILFITDIKTDVNVTYLIKNYENPLNLDKRLRKCESFNYLGDNCDPVFHFSAFSYFDNGRRRSTFRREIGPFVNAKTVRNVLETFEIHRSFPDTIEIELDIQDNDIDEDQEIALFRRQLPLNGCGEYELSMGVDVKVEIFVQISCTKNYYGKQCEVYCEPISGVWNCDLSTGARICIKPCVNGHCVLTDTNAICQCTTSDWSGELCNIPFDGQIISKLYVPNNPSIEPVDYVKKSNDKISSHLNIINQKPSENQFENDLKSKTDQFSQNNELKQLDKKNSEQIINLNFDSINNKLNKIELEETKNSIQNNFKIKNKDSVESIPNVTNVYEKCENCEQSINQNNSETLQTIGLLTHATNHHYAIFIAIALGITIWLIAIIGLTTICYRRRRHTKSSIRSSSIWSNKNYEHSTFLFKKSTLSNPLNDIHSYENTQHSPISYLNEKQNQPQLNFDPLPWKATSPKSILRNKNRSETVRYMRTSNQSNKSSFGTMPSIIITSSPTSLTPQLSTSVRQQTPIISPREKECLETNDTYEELSCNPEDYKIWEPSQNRKLTTFQ